MEESVMRAQFHLDCFAIYSSGAGSGGIIGIVLGGSLGVTPARAAGPIVVNTTDGGAANDAFCSLYEAISNANDDGVDHSNGACVLGSGSDTIRFDDALGTATITLTGALPVD